MTLIGRQLASALGSFSIGLALVAAVPALAECEGLPDHRALRAAITEAAATVGGPPNGRLALHLSATTMDRNGTACTVKLSVAYGGGPADQGAARDPWGPMAPVTPGAETLTEGRTGDAAILGAGGPPLGGKRVAVGAGFAAGGQIRKDPPLSARHLAALRRRALRQGF